MRELRMGRDKMWERLRGKESAGYLTVSKRGRLSLLPLRGKQKKAKENQLDLESKLIAQVRGALFNCQMQENYQSSELGNHSLV